MHGRFCHALCVDLKGHHQLLVSPAKERKLGGFCGPPVLCLHNQSVALYLIAELVYPQGSAVFRGCT